MKDKIVKILRVVWIIMYITIHLLLCYVLFLGTFTAFEWIVIIFLVLIYYNIITFEGSVTDLLKGKKNE
jgi:hypothetical protein